jgi:hypothetical protein
MLTEHDTKLIEAVEAVVAERGEDFVYEAPEGDSCKYVHVAEDFTPVPGCLFGAALHRTGVSLEDLSQVEGDPVFDLLPPDAYSAAVRAAAESAQGAQDTGHEYGEVLVRFRRRIGIEA